MVEKLVDIGERCVCCREMGQGKYTVFFENAMGNTLKNWWPVQLRISEKNHTIGYDRCGSGKSDRATSKRNAFNMAKELKLLMDNLHITNPCILVGASYGCFIIRAFVDLYPEKIAGAVFVEPSHEDFFEMLKTMHQDSYEEYEYLWKLTSEFGGETYKNEWENFESDCKYMKSLSFPDYFPIYVISSIRCKEREQILMKLEQEDVNMRCDLHKNWLIHGNVTQIITDKSGHNVLGEEPELIVNTISSLIKDVERKEIIER